MLGPAFSVMAMSPDCHVVDCGWNPGPCGLNSHWACVRACPKSREENGGEGLVAWPSPWGVISCFLSLCLSLSFWRAHVPYSKKLSKKCEKKK